MAPPGKAENFIENISGCGPFQVIVFAVVVFTTTSTLSYALIVMAFGNYNPGWRCMDNATNPNTSVAIDPNELQYTLGSCDVYNDCQNVEFDPETSTIVTEWGLLCDKAWMSSTTISIQMFGMLIGSIVGGQLSDTLGRKIPLYGGIALCGLMQLFSAFSVSWSMFAVFIFFLGALSTTNMIVVMLYVSELMTMKWRGIIISLPLWYIGFLLMSMVAMITKDWRQVQYVGFALHVICFIPVFWIPESIRWLEAKRKAEKFSLIVKKIGHWNKTVQSPTLDCDGEDLTRETKVVNDGDGKKYTIIDLFRHGYALISICLGVITGIFSIIFYATTFGTKALYGDFYVNLIISNAIAIPIFLIALIPMRYMNRKRVTFLLLIIPAVCIFSATGLLFASSDSAKSIGSTVLISVAKATMDFGWFCMYSRVTEIYPTVVRGIGIGYVSVTARITGLMAPFVIPEDKDNLYVFTLASGVAILLICILNLGLPETKGKPLKETFHDCNGQLPVNERSDSQIASV